MADSIPSLRIKLGEAMRRIAELEAKLAAKPIAPPAVIETPVYIDRYTYAADPAQERQIERLRARIRELSGG